MPNTEVKLTNAESTWPEAAREDRKLLIDIKKDTQRSVFFYMLINFQMLLDIRFGLLFQQNQRNTE